MATEHADDLVPFLDVKVIRSTAPALLCRVKGRNVWLPRRHISGKLWCTGDRGKLFIRRWVACDRNLFDLPVVPLVSPVPSLPSRPLLPGELHLVRREPIPTEIATHAPARLSVVIPARPTVGGLPTPCR